jgi:hypothetical protein
MSGQAPGPALGSWATGVKGYLSDPSVMTSADADGSGAPMVRHAKNKMQSVAVE